MATVNTESEALDTTDGVLDPADSQEEAFVPYEIVSYPSDLTLEGIKTAFEAGDIIIPPFQRGFVWDIHRSSRLIESFLLGLPVPQVFLHIDIENDRKAVIIDGQQRIRSVVYYMKEEFPHHQGRSPRVFKLTGLDKQRPFAGQTFSQLKPHYQLTLRTAVLRAINIRQIDPKEDDTSIYYIFERLNTGGVPLKPQEIRNCVYRGEFNEILLRLNENNDWRQIFGAEHKHKNQKDVELVLRIFALSNLAAGKYEKPLKEFLNKTMKKFKNGTAEEVKTFAERFPRTVQIVLQELGQKPFHIRGPLNATILDAVLCTVFDNIETLPIGKLREHYNALKQDGEFVNITSQRTTEILAMQERFNIARRFLIGTDK